MAKRKNTDLRNGLPVDPGFNFANRMKAIQREQDKNKKKQKPSVPHNKAHRVG